MAWEKQAAEQEAAYKKELKEREKAFKKATGLKLPAGTQYDHDGGASWHKRGGYAGGKTLRDLKALVKKTGWTMGSATRGNTPDGTNFWDSTDYVDPSKQWILCTRDHIGVTKSENSYSFTVKRVPAVDAVV